MSRRFVLALAGAAVCAAAYQVVPASSQGGMILQIEIRSNPQPTRPSDPVNTLQDFTAALRRCYSPPPIDDVSQPVDLTFQVSFKRSGELFGKPRVVSFARAVSQEERQRYYLAVAETLICARQCRLPRRWVEHRPAGPSGSVSSTPATEDRQ